MDLVRYRNLKYTFRAHRAVPIATLAIFVSTIERNSSRSCCGMDTALYGPQSERVVHTPELYEVTCLVQSPSVQCLRNSPSIRSKLAADKKVPYLSSLSLAVGVTSNPTTTEYPLKLSTTRIRIPDLRTCCPRTSTTARPIR